MSQKTQKPTRESTHRWAQAFAGIVQNLPNWYAGSTPIGNGFNPILFTNNMSYMLS
jgi:hypothetical protein